MIDFFNLANLESSFFVVTKAFFVICSIFYFIFSLIVVRQVAASSKSVTDKFNPILIAFSYIHLAFAVVLILMMLGL